MLTAKVQLARLRNCTTLATQPRGTQGKHTSTVNLDEMRRTAMGPVLTSKDDLLKEVAALVAGDVKSDIYSERRAREFACCDGLASQRIYDILSAELRQQSR